MKFTVSTSLLSGALSIVGKCVAPNKIMPILDSFLFETKGDQLIISGSDLQIYLTTTITVEGDNPPDSISIPGGRLQNLINALPDQPIGICSSHDQDGSGGRSILITALSGEYEIPVDEGRNFPVMKHERLTEFKIDGTQLIAGIEKTLFLVGTDESRPNLTGINVECEGDSVVFTSCNGHALSTFSQSGDIGIVRNFLIPSKSFGIIKSLPHSAQIEVSLSDDTASFKLNEKTVLKTRLIGEKFPDYKSVIPETNPVHVEVDRLELIASLKRVTQFANKVDSGVRFEFRANHCELIGEDVDFKTSGRERLMCHTSTGDITIGLKGPQIIDCVSKYSTDTVHLYFSTPDRAVVIRDKIAEEHDKTNLILSMPIMLKDLN